MPRLTAYALCLLDLDVVARSTIRALLGTGRVRRKHDVAYARDAARGQGAGHSGKNVNSQRFQDALRQFERSGWIRRGQEYLLIIDRTALFEFAVHELTLMPSKLLDLEGAVQAAQADLTRPQITPSAIEQAHRELAALRRLMRAPVSGANHTGQHSVRRVGPAGSGE